METPPFTDSIDGATATALLEEQERITQSALWKQHEALHDSRGEEASFLFTTTHPADEETKQPTAQEPLYKEGTFPVGGCSCGFEIKSDNQGTLTGTNGTQTQNNSFTITYSAPQSSTRTYGTTTQSSTTGMYGTATMYK